MAIDALVASLARDGQAEVDRIVAEAAAREAAMRAEAARAADAASAAHAADVARAHGARVEAALAALEQAARHQRLTARAALLARVRAAADAAAARADEDPAWQAHLPALIGAGRRAAGDAPLRIRCRSPLAALVRDLAPDAVVVADLDAAGILVEVGDKLVIDGTIASWLDQAFPGLARRVLDRVGG